MVSTNHPDRPVEFRILGPLEVRRGTEIIPIAAGRERVLLATLLLRAGRLVPVDELVDRLWGERPPANPRAALHMCVNRLRKRLGPDREVIHSEGRTDGYAAAPPWLDLTEFRRLVGAADEAKRRADRQAEAALLREGLALWRGPVLSDVDPGSLPGDLVPSLAEEHLAQLLRRIDVDLALGRAPSVISELRGLLADHPLHERVATQLITALGACGRRAEARTEYEAICRRLADELGVDPGEELRAAHRAATRTQAPDSASLRPRQLPPDVRGFTGRARELELLDDGAAVITIIAGTAGVGKTALATHWARRVADDFPDGQLWVNLRGYDPEQPTSPRYALTVFLRALGIPAAEIPYELDKLTDLYRVRTRDRRILVVLDNASGADQVRPLLPESSHCRTLITSRDDFSELATRNGVRRIRLDLLDRSDAIALLRTLLGTDRLDADRNVLAQLAELCARLPLALRILADRVSDADGRLPELTASLIEQPRLDAFSAGADAHTALRSVFSWSYGSLSPAATRLFRMLSLIPGPDWDALAAAAIAGIPPGEAHGLLTHLAAKHLMERRNARFQMHDLLRAYGRELADSEDTEAGREQAMARLLDYYLGAASAAVDVILPHERNRRPSIPRSDRELPPLPDPAAAAAWLDDEKPSLVAGVAYAASHGMPRHATLSAAILHRYLLTRDQYSEAATISQAALAAARTSGDRNGEADALINLGSINYQRANFTTAIDRTQQALALYRMTQNRVGQGIALGSLGSAYRLSGRLAESVRYHLLALTSHREVGDRNGEAHTLNNLGTTSWLFGKYDEAHDFLLKSLTLRRELGDRTHEALSLNNLGTLQKDRGDQSSALDYHRQALTVSQDCGFRAGEAYALDGIGGIHNVRGQYDLAREYCERALDIAKEIGKPTIQIDALINLGLASRRTERHADAILLYQQALELARQSGAPFDQGRALDGLARARHSLGEDEAAREHWKEALAIYTDLGVPAADEVRAVLAGLEMT